MIRRKLEEKIELLTPWIYFLLIVVSVLWTTVLMVFIIRQQGQLRNFAEQNRVLAKQGKEAHDGICTLKRDYRERIRQSKDFLKEFPNGTTGIPAGALRLSIANTQRTLDALSKVTCK